MTAIYVTATTEYMEEVLNEVFVPGVDFTITFDDRNEDNSRTARAEWDGEFVRAVEFRAQSHPQVVSYQIM